LDTKKYNFKKLYFSQFVIINNPGIIISKSFNFVNNLGRKIRVVYTFEKIYVDLYFNTLQKIGKEKTDELWYRVGKDISIRYLLMNKKFFSLSKFEKIIKHFQEIFRWGGLDFLENLNYDLNKKYFEFSCNNNLFCKKIGNFSFMEGFASGLISFILRENLEAESFYNKKTGFYKIIICSSFKKKHAPNFSFLKIYSKYNLNFLEIDKFKSSLSSFSDFLRFNLIKLDSGNKFLFKGETIIFSEIGFPEIFAMEYKQMGYKKIFENSVKKSCEELCDFYLLKLKSSEEKTKLFRNLMSAFGFGEIYLRKEKNKIRVSFLKSIYINFDLIFLKSVINGFLNYIYKKNFVFQSGDNKHFWYVHN
jgi:hypothetical protein